MTFIKSLKMTRKKKGQAPLQIPKKLLVQHRFVTGQASLEYFVIFGLVAILTIASLSSALPMVQKAAQGDGETGGFFQAAIADKGVNVANIGVDGPVPAPKFKLMKCGKFYPYHTISYAYLPYDPERVNKLIDGLYCVPD